jgi:hypothetical protein
MEQGMIDRAYRLKRTLDNTELDWLDDGDVFEEGSIVYEYTGPTYGCITPAGMACTRVARQTPFVELPLDALEWVGVVDSNG